MKRTALRKTLSAFGLILAVTSSAQALLVTGAVQDQDGLPMEGATVTFTRAGARSQTASALTDDGGRYEVDLSLTTAVSLSESGAAPGAAILFQNYPNPFNPTTVIPVRLAQAGEVRLSIHNSLGQRVRTLVHGPLAAGLHRLRWDATDDAGRGVAAGTYLYRMQAGDVVQTGKMVLVDGHSAQQAAPSHAGPLPLASDARQPAGRALATPALYTITATGHGFFDYTRHGVAIDADATIDLMVNSTTDRGMVRLGLSDASSDGAEAVLMTVSEVAIRREADGPWQSFAGQAQIVDLPALTQGASHMLGEQVLEPGPLTGVRLVVDEVRIAVEGEVHDLTMPSGSQGEVELRGRFEVVPGGTLDLTLALDTGQSIVRPDQDAAYELRPVVRLVEAGTPVRHTPFLLHDARGPGPDAYAEELGINTTPIFLDHWGQYEPNDDEWHWERAVTGSEAEYDHVFVRIGAMHVLAWNPPQAMPDWVDRNDLDGRFREEYGEFVTEAVRHFSSRAYDVDLYLVELEANAAAIELGKTNTWLIDWIKWEAGLIRSADPNARIAIALANADMVPNQYVGDKTEDDIYMSTRAFIGRMVEAGVDFDVIAFSVSSGVYNKLDDWAELAEYVTSLLAFGKELYVYSLAYPANRTEAATLYYPREGGYSEAWQAEQYAESLRFLLETEEVIGASFPLYDYYEPPLNTPYEWGLVAGDQYDPDTLVKRRSFDAVKALWRGRRR